MTNCRIGQWEFEPDGNELRRGAERIRLEHRAARALELLCDHRGEVVSQDRLRAEIWNGRHLSAHSLPIVIGQLRRALGEDARNPQYIETIPKRGYRLLGEGTSEMPVRRSNRPWTIAAAALLSVVALVGALYMRMEPARPAIGFTEVINQTGSAKYDPLARATDEVLLTALTKRGFQVQRGPGATKITLQARLVLWNGTPSVGLTTTGSNGTVTWSGTTLGGASKIPSEVGRNLDEMRTVLKLR